MMAPAQALVRATQLEARADWYAGRGEVLQAAWSRARAEGLRRQAAAWMLAGFWSAEVGEA